MSQISATGSGGGGLDRDYPEGDPRSVSVSEGGSFDIPAGEVWLCTVVSSDIQNATGEPILSTNGTSRELREGKYEGLILDDSVTIESDMDDYDGGAVYVHGVDVSDSVDDPVCKIDPTVPAGETWTGALCGGSAQVNNNYFPQTEYEQWVHVSDGDELVGFFGGVVR